MADLAPTGKIGTSRGATKYIEVSFGLGESGTHSLVDTEVAKSADSVQVMWHYPGKYLILIIETPFSAQKEPYAILISKDHPAPDASNYRQIIDGEEIKPNAAGCHIRMESDDNYQVVLKILNPSEGQLYGIMFTYQVVAK